MRTIAKKTGHVYWANSKKIDKEDKKSRRQYVVVRDSNNYVAVSKIRGYNSNDKNANRLYRLDKNKYPLTKDSGVDKKIYHRRSDTGKLLKLNDSQIFDKEHSFKLSSGDTHRVIEHTGINNKKRRKH